MSTASSFEYTIEGAEGEQDTFEVTAVLEGSRNSGYELMAVFVCHSDGKLRERELEKILMEDHSEEILSNAIDALWNR